MAKDNQLLQLDLSNSWNCASAALGRATGRSALETVT